MSKEVEERLKLIHQRLGPMSSLRIETQGVRGSFERIQVTIYWQYSLCVSKPYRRWIPLAEESTIGHSLFEALCMVLMAIDALEASLTAGLSVGADRHKSDHY
jgi:hypothetical protein